MTALGRHGHWCNTDTNTMRPATTLCLCLSPLHRMKPTCSSLLEEEQVLDLKNVHPSMEHEHHPPTPSSQGP